MSLTPEHLATIHARRETAREWFQYDSKTADDVRAWYRQSRALPLELEAWHREPTRASWSKTIADLARMTDRRVAIDIGCGLGHDLLALRDAGLVVCGVEPNEKMREYVKEQGIRCYADFDTLSDFDLVLCMDVLEHLRHPETMLARITRLTQPGTILVEHTPTWDLADPLHFVANYGWLVKDYIGEQWKYISRPDDPVGVWQRI